MIQFAKCVPPGTLLLLHTDGDQIVVDMCLGSGGNNRAQASWAQVRTAQRAACQLGIAQTYIEGLLLQFSSRTNCR